MAKLVSYHLRKAAGAAMLVVLLAVAIILILYFGRFGKSSESYVEKTISAKGRTERKISGINMAGVYQAMRIFSAGHDGKFPKTPQQLARDCDLPQGYIYRPDQPKEQHFVVYVPGQDESMPASNILIYQDSTDKDGTGLVLRLNGKVERLTANQLQDALAQTSRQIRQAGHR